MEVSVNQQHYSVPQQCNVQALLCDVLSQSTHGLAVAVNQTIVPKTQWETHLLLPGDEIIIIKATQGG